MKNLPHESANGSASEWFLIDQERVNRLADVTLDHQFVHVDLERAKSTPFGGTTQLTENLPIDFLKPRGVGFAFESTDTTSLVMRPNHFFDRFTQSIFKIPSYTQALARSEHVSGIDFEIRFEQIH